MTRDRISGAIATVIGSVMLPFALQIQSNNPFASKSDLGPRFFPVMGCCIMIIAGIGLIVSSPKEQKRFFTLAQWKELIGMYILTAAYIFVMSKTGFLSATVVYLFIVCSLFLRENHMALWKRVLYAIVIGGAIYCLFTYILGIRLMTGFLI